MAVELLLIQDVAGLGKEGDVVRVADGYARNYLLPKRLAAPVTEATRRQIEARRRQREEQRRRELEEAQNLARRLAEMSVTLTLKAGEGEKLFGAVTSSHIAEALKAQGIEIDHRRIELPDPIRELGVFSVPIRLHPEVLATLKVWVVEE